MRFKCKRCGSCCKNMVVPLVFTDFELWAREGLWHVIASVVKRRHGLERLGVKEYYVLPRRADGTCLFYKEGYGCTIYEYRPLVCRLFPFAYTSDGGITLHPWASRNCPGVRDGEPLDARTLNALRALAAMIFREVVSMHCYISFLDELVEEARRRLILFQAEGFRGTTATSTGREAWSSS